jgi:hypothetical protein
MTDAEIETLAREILPKVIADVKEMGALRDVRESASGELIPIYGGTSKDGYGSFRCEYLPLPAVKKIIAECESIYDTFIITVTDVQTGVSVEQSLIEYSPESRETSIKLMAELATLHLIESFFVRLADVLMEDVKDSALMANSVLAEVVGGHFSELGVSQPIADARPDIDKSSERVADAKRELLRHHLRKLSFVVAERGRGRIPKSDLERKQDSERYEAEVECAYRRVRAATGKKPTKISIARELGEGGINPKTYGESSAQAFRAKLQRSNLDYAAIAEKVEKELN